MKKGKNTLIVKMGIVIAIVALIAAGCGKNSGDGESSGRGDDAQEQTSGHESDGDAQAAGAFVDWDVVGDTVEEYGYQPFWLKYANLGALEEKDLSRIIFCNGFAFGASMEEALTGLSQYGYGYFSWDYGTQHSTNIEDLLEWADTTMIKSHDTMKINCYPSASSYDGREFEVYNLADSETSVRECMDNGWFSTCIDMEDFGLSPWHQDNRKQLPELVEILGKPSMVTYIDYSAPENVVRDEDETFAEKVSRGGGFIWYQLVYIYGDKILSIDITECITKENFYTDIKGIYMTQSIYDDDPIRISIGDCIYEFEGTQEPASGSGTGDDTQGQSVGFTGDWNIVEEGGFPPFWFKYANLGALEEKDFSDLMFYDKFAFGASLEEMISSYNDFSIFDYYSPNDSGFPSNVSGLNSLEEFKEWATTNMIRAGQHYNSLELWCYTAEDDYSDKMKVQIYNLTDSEVTVWECIQNGQFFWGNCGYADENGFRELGVPYNGGDSVDNREALTELVEILGKPSMVANCGNGFLSWVDRDEDEEFDETVSLGGGQIGYTLVYDRGDYILQIRVSELATIAGRYLATSCHMNYLTRDVYEYRQEKYPDSTEIIQEVYDFE